MFLNWFYRRCAQRFLDDLEAAAALHRAQALAAQNAWMSMFAPMELGLLCWEIRADAIREAIR